MNTSQSIVLLTAALQGAIAWLLLKRNKRAEFPVFFWYNALSAIGGLILFVGVIVLSPIRYFHLFWIVNPLLMLVEFGVMYEIFVKALKPYHGLIDLGKMLFRWAAAFLFLASTLTAFATTDNTLMKCVAAAVQFQRSIRLVQCGLLLLFFLFERRLGLAWRSRPVSIGLGMGIYASLSLSSSYLYTKFPQITGALDFIDYIQYFAVLAFWAVCFYLPEPERHSVLESPSKLIFQRWNDALVATRFAAAGASASISGIDSFLPNVEQTVDRVLARKIAQ